MMSVKNLVPKLLWLLCAFLVVIVVYHFYFASKIIPGIRVGTVSLSGLAYEQAVEKLENYGSAVDKKFNLTTAGIMYEISADEVDLTYDWEKTAASAYSVGRTGKIFEDTKNKIQGLIASVRLPAIYFYTNDVLLQNLSEIEAVLNVDPVDAHYVIDNGLLAIENSKAGRKIPLGFLDLAVAASFGNLDFSEKEITITNALPVLYKDDLEKKFTEVEELISDPLVVFYEDYSWTVSSEQKLELINLTKEKEDIALSLDLPAAQAFVDRIGVEVNDLPRGRVLANENGEVLDFVLVDKGQEIDEDQFFSDFEKALFAGDLRVELSMKTISGPEDPAKYGIFSLIGTGESLYRGSARERANNLILAADRVSGVLVPPDGEFSFNNSVGEISGRTGYDSAYIISNGRTILGEGGGVCQTSTTVFRAALNAGLPITLRYGHAYRVTYYEQDLGVGFDASVYQPSLDFRFKNDTSNYILIQSKVDKSEQKLTFEIYGTPDNREVEISDSLVTNLVPPPEALHQEDPTLSKGAVKQVDFPAWGARASFTRVVKRNGIILHEDVFTTNYQPWRAVYLVGTRD
jgi:vancomycin resistance protein YoaR